MDRKGRQMIQALRIERPNVAITIMRFEDYIAWDGDGPSPSFSGMVCYTYDVTAFIVHNGRLIKGRASLGSCWYHPDDESENEREIGGYLPQMIDEALKEMDEQLKESR